MCADHPTTHHHTHPSPPHLCLCTADKDLRTAQQCRHQNGKSTFQPSLSLAVVPTAFHLSLLIPWASPNPSAQSPRAQERFHFQFSLTGQHANPSTQERLDGKEEVTRPEVKGTILGRGPRSLVICYSCKLAGWWKLSLRATHFGEATRSSTKR